VRLSLLREHGGPVRGHLAVARDISSRRQVQRELARLATAVEQAAEAVILTDTEGVTLYVNPAFERITGYSAAEAVGQTPRLLKSGLQDRAFYAALWSTIRSGRTWEGRFTNRRKDGGLFIEDASISPIREHESGRLIGYVALKRDDPPSLSSRPTSRRPRRWRPLSAGRRRRSRLQHARRHPRAGRRRRPQSGRDQGSSA
jgi:PAS domain S-box-containing protein